MYYIPDPIITPCTVGVPLFVLISNMSSSVYRNVRFGIYRDYTIRTSVIDKAFQAQAMPPSRHPVEIIFKSAMMTSSPHGSGVADMEDHVSEKEMSLEEVNTCSRKDTTLKQQERMEV